MPERIRKLAFATLATVLIACGDVEVPIHQASVTPPSIESGTTYQAPRTTPVRIDWGAIKRLSDAAVWHEIVRLSEAVARERAAERQRASSLVSRPAVTASPPGLEPCGGDLPPCWRVQTESGGSYNAFNPGGCGGNNCYGKYQFSGEWACKLGLPCDLATATPAQQDAAARQLWAGGAGCGNWAAC